ncbi:MAG: hypothetical protein JWQ35_628 [Bacteriovoracaceae bacterium]|nr:hypothetical protein [Bacteriovoracaceae bacterium]
MQRIKIITFLFSLGLLFSACGFTDKIPSSKAYNAPTYSKSSSDSNNSKNAIALPSISQFRFFCADQTISAFLTTFIEEGSPSDNHSPLYWNDPESAHFMLLNINEPLAISSENGKTKVIFQASVIGSKHADGDAYRNGIYFGSFDWQTHDGKTQKIAADLNSSRFMEQVLSDRNRETKKHFALDSKAQNVLLPSSSQFLIEKISIDDPVKLDPQVMIDCNPVDCWNPLFDLEHREAAFTSIDPNSSRFRLKVFKWMDTKHVQSLDPFPVDDKADQWSPFILNNGSIIWLESHALSLSFVAMDSKSSVKRFKILDLDQSEVDGEAGWNENANDQSLELVFGLKNTSHKNATYQMKLLKIDSENRSSTVSDISLPISTDSKDSTVRLSKVISIQKDFIYASFRTPKVPKIYRYVRSKNTWEIVNSTDCPEAASVLERVE